jgi:GDPmannose 4,6-dehydratase
MKTAVIVGSKGQDGRLLDELLTSEGTRVIGLSRDGASASDGSWSQPVDVADSAAILRLLAATRPDEIYYVAAHHHSSEQKPEPPDELRRKSEKVHVQGPVNFLEAIARGGLPARFFYAASRLIFGTPKTDLLDENSPIAPEEVYGVTKAAGLKACRDYRRSRGVFACAGILFNHESPLRQPYFLSRKIVTAARAIKAGGQTELKLGDLDARLDWGYAPDYVEAMRRIMRHCEADDFVVATGELHRVGELVEAVFSRLGLDWRKHVRADPSILAARRPAAAGDAAKLRRATGWKPSVTFEQMVDGLLREETAAR